MISKKLIIALFLSSGLVLQAKDAAPKVDFVTQVKPIFEATCIGCHGPKEAEGDYRMDTKELAFKGGESYEGETILAGNSNNSPVYWMTTEPSDSDDVMPPENQAPLTEAQQNIIRDWIDQGAHWPEGVTLVQTQRVDFQQHVLPVLKKGGPFSAKQKETLSLWVSQGAVWPEGFSMADAGAGDDGPADNLDLVVKMRETIVAASTEKSFEEMKPYENSIPKTGAKYQMVPIPGGSS